MKAYLITFDAAVTDIYRAHSAITSVPGEEWWHYINGTYIVTSHLAIDDFRDDLMSKWPGGWMLIIEVKANADGWLPKEAWDWINSRIV